MVDPLSPAASVIAVIELAAKLTTELLSYIQSVKDATKEQKSLAREAASAYSLLISLQFRVDEAGNDEKWLNTVRMLGTSDGVLDLYCQALVSLKPAAKEPTSTMGRAKSSLTWRFKRENVKRTLEMLERVKSSATLALQNDLLSLMQVINETTFATRTRLEAMDERASAEEKREVESWLSPDDATTVQAGKASQRQNNTGQWFLDATQDWQHGSKRRQWCLGMPGAGKTILASHMIDHVYETHLAEDKRMAYFYFNYKQKETQDADHVFRSLLKQLVQQADSVSEDVRELRTQFEKRGMKPHGELLRNALIKELRSSTETWIVIDAFDESTEEGSTRAQLLKLLRNASHSARWLITSRDLPWVRHTMDDKNADESEPLTVAAHEGDVRRYVEGRIDRDADFNDMTTEYPWLKAKITEKVAKSAQGMFLMAVLHMDSLVYETNAQAVLDALETLPEGIDEAYDSALNRMGSQGKKAFEQAKRTIMWVVSTQRPLHLDEFNHALTIKAGKTSISKLEVEKGERFVSKCAGLVVVEKGSKLVRLVHETAQEYFNKQRVESIVPGAARIMAEACLSYLGLEALSEGPHENAAETAKRIDDLPFLRYSARYWGYHVSYILDDADIKESTLRLLADPKRLSASVQVLSLPDQPDLAHLDLTAFHRPQYEGSTGHVYLEAPALCMAANFGLCEIAERLIHLEPESVKVTCSQKRTPLHYASGNGHLSMVNLLIRHGVDVNACDEHGVSALHLAADSKSHASTEVIEALLSAGARTEARTKSLNEYSDWSYSMPIHWAAWQPSGNNVEALVKGGADVEAGNAWFRTPLHIACRHKRLEVMQKLIALGANVNSERDGRGTPLCWAAEHGHLEAAKLLLQNGANLCVSSYQGTPLELAIVGNHPALAKFFRNQDCSHEGKGDLVRFTIRSAMNRHGHRDRAKQAVIKLLDTLPNADRDAILAEELSAALAFPEFSAVDFLVGRGANLGQTDQFGRTVMHMSLHYDRFDFFDRGLQAGLDYRAADAQGCQPIHHAASGNCLKGLRWLLEKSIDLNDTDSNGWTPLHWAAFQGHHQAVDLLLSAGSSLDATDTQYRTPLHIACAVRPADQALLQMLGASDWDICCINDSTQYSPEENAWYFVCALNGQRMHQVVRGAKEFDVQWDRQLGLALDHFTKHEKGRCGNARAALLFSKSNEVLFNSGLQRAVEAGLVRSHTAPNGMQFNSLSAKPERPAFCDCCSYVIIKHPSCCTCGEVKLCLRCRNDAAALFPRHTFVE